MMVAVSPVAQARPAKPPRPEPPPATPAEVEQQETIPDETLRQMYKAELGRLYDPADADKLLEAHRLLEDYFATTASKERKAIVAELEANGTDPNILGRIVRLRMHWPALEGGGVYYTNERHGVHDVRYFLGVPADYDRTKSWPLVVRLPTAHAFVTDPPPGPEQVVQIYTDWIKDELEKHPDALVLMPLLNLDELYGPGYAGMNNVIQPLLHVGDRVNVDPTQVYLVGHSMGAHAVWNLAVHYATYFAAINPLAGAMSQPFQRLRMMNLSNVLPVVWHDAGDDVIKPKHSQVLVNLLRKLDLDVEFEQTKGVGHAPTEEIAERAYRKMRARKRELYPGAVLLQSNRPDTMFNRLDWLQVYQPLTPGEQKRRYFSRGSGYFTLNQNAHHAQAVRTGRNRFELKTNNVATLRIYVNDRTCDFREPVQVVVNKKPRFEGMVKPSVEQMLKDQVFLGRGWRYFTGVIDIDLAPPPKAATRPAKKPGTRPAKKKPSGNEIRTRGGGTIRVGPDAER